MAVRAGAGFAVGKVSADQTDYHVIHLNQWQCCGPAEPCRPPEPSIEARRHVPRTQCTSRGGGGWRVRRGTWRGPLKLYT